MKRGASNFAKVATKEGLKMGSRIIGKSKAALERVDNYIAGQRQADIGMEDSMMSQTSSHSQV